MKTPLTGALSLVCALLLAAPALAQRRPTEELPRPGVLARPPLPAPGGGAPPAPGAARPATPAAQQPAPQAGGAASERVARPTPSCDDARRRARFGVYFDKVEIEKLVQTVADATCKTFILPENVRGRVSIVGPENGRAEVNADEFYRLFLAALEANGLAVYPSGNFLKLVDKRAAKQNPIPTMGEDTEYTSAEQMITRLFRVKNVELEPLRGVLQQLVSKDGDTIPFPPDMIIINDTGANMHRLERIVAQLDQPAANTFVRVVQVQFASAGDVAGTLQKIFEQKPGAGRAGARTAAPGVDGAQSPQGGQEGGGASGPVTVGQIIPDERTNKLIIAASPAAFERIEALIREIDVPMSGEGRINVYYLENANAEDLAGTLQSLSQGSPNAGRRGGAVPSPAPGVPGGARPGGGATTAELFSGEVKISADKATNSLVIIASQSDYRNLVRVIERLDIPQRQVFVEAVIMEVNLTRNSEFGINLHSGVNLNTPLGQTPGIIGTNTTGNGLPPSLNLATGLSSFGGFLAGLSGPPVPVAAGLNINLPQFGILLHMLQSSSDVNVLSTPHILTSNNEEAEISVGQNVPFQAGFQPQGLGALGGLAGQAGAAGGLAGGLGGLLGGGLAGGGLGSLFAPISRQNVELKLTVKPQINESDFIRLAITQQTEEIASRDQVLGPTTSKRSVKTTVVAKDQETVVLGGIMQDRITESVRKVPLLGDIPLLGHLFRDTRKEKTKTNLLLFLTPYIIRDSGDFRRIFEKKLKERQQFVEQFYGQVPEFDVPIDLREKAGPLVRMNQLLQRESRKLENGGPGEPGERVVAPGARAAPPAPPAPAGQPAAPPGGQEGVQPASPTPGATPPGGAAPPPEGVAGPEVTAPADGSTPDLRPPPEQQRLQPGAEAPDDD
jgi:general secretion pathway protein D